MLPSCLWTHCIDAPNATNGSYLTKLIYNSSAYSYPETEVEFDDQVEYHCFNGMKGKEDFGFTNQVATCRAGNVWEPPANWTHCTDSKQIFILCVSVINTQVCVILILAKYCPIPPAGITNGTVFVNSTGNRFGVVCLGTLETDGDEEEMVMIPSCPLVQVRYTVSSFCRTFTYSTLS